MAKFTNTTEKTPLGIGALGLLIEPGASVSVSTEDMRKAAESPVVRYWVESGMLTAEPDDGDEAEAERKQREAEELAALEAAEAERKQREAEELAALEAAEAERKQREADEAAKAAGGPPKVPTPTPKR